MLDCVAVGKSTKFISVRATLSVNTGAGFSITLPLVQDPNLLAKSFFVSL